MRQKGITKTPGCSWIGIDNNLREFHAGDGLCLDSTDISNIIDLLYEELLPNENACLAHFNKLSFCTQVTLHSAHPVIAAGITYTAAKLHQRLFR